MSNNTVVLAIFKDEMAADVAGASLKDSGVAKKDAIGVLALNEKGELKTDKAGKRSMGKGAGIGTALALVTPVGLGVGIIGGGLLGSLHHKNLGLDDADRERIGRELQGAWPLSECLLRFPRPPPSPQSSKNSAGPRKLMRSLMRFSTKHTQRRQRASPERPPAE